MLWRHLRLRQLEGYKFRRQQPLGPYIVDFVCFEKRLIIELDGGQHNEQVAYDSERSAWLAKRGYRVLIFCNDQLLKEIGSVKDVIAEALGCQFETPHLYPPPQGGRKDADNE